MVFDLGMLSIDLDVDAICAL